MPTAQVYRRLGYIGAAKQTVQGTAVAPTTFFKFLRHAFVANQVITSYRDPTTRDRTFSLKEIFKDAGSFQTFLYSDEGAALLAWAMGLDTKTGASDPYTHTITLTDGLPWISFELGQYIDNTGLYGLVERVADCKLTGLQIEGQAGKPVLLTPDLVGITVAKQATAATVTYSAYAGEPMTFSQGVFTITGPADAATLVGQITKFNISIKQNIEPVQANAFVPIYLLEKGRDVDLTFDAVFPGPSLYQLTHFGPPQDSGTATGGGASTLTDTAKSWTVNAWATFLVQITGGTGRGQVRSIASNTATILTVSSAWTTTPDATSTYAIGAASPSTVLGTGTFEVKFTAQATPEHSVDITIGALDWSAVKLEMNPDSAVGTMSVTAIPRKSGAILPLAAVVKNAVATAYC